nr:RhuM family protein [Aliarcobacter butzleri]
MVFLETAELRAKNKEDITMDFWRENIDRIIEFNDKKLLKDNGSISNEQMKKMVEKVYETFDSKRKKQEAIEADYEDLKELKQIEERAKKKL